MAGTGRSDMTVTGMVIRAEAVGENDRRLVLLTRERGKIAAFARGARRQGSALLSLVPFCYGTMHLYAGRDYYVVKEAQVSEYFSGLRGDVEAACYASYFAEVTAYLTRENNDESMLLLLLYASLLALQRGQHSRKLIRSVFEIRAIVTEGEYPGLPGGRPWSESVARAAEHIASADTARLFSFRMSPEAEAELAGAAQILMDGFTDRHFSSLDILRSLANS